MSGRLHLFSMSYICDKAWGVNTIQCCSVSMIQWSQWPSGSVSVHRKCTGQSQQFVRRCSTVDGMFECPRRNDGMYDWSVPLCKLKNDPLTTHHIQELLKTSIAAPVNTVSGGAMMLGAKYATTLAVLKLVSISSHSGDVCCHVWRV